MERRHDWPMAPQMAEAVCSRGHDLDHCDDTKQALHPRCPCPDTQNVKKSPCVAKGTRRMRFKLKILRWGEDVDFLTASKVVARVIVGWGQSQRPGRAKLLAWKVTEGVPSPGMQTASRSWRRPGHRFSPGASRGGSALPTHIRPRPQIRDRRSGLCLATKGGHLFQQPRDTLKITVFLTSNISCVSPGALSPISANAK